MKSVISMFFCLSCITSLALVSCGGSDSESSNPGGGAGTTSSGGSAGSGTGGSGTGGSSGGSAGSATGGSNSGSGGSGAGGSSSGSGGSGTGGSGGFPGSHQVCEDAQELAEQRQETLNCEGGAGLIQVACEIFLAFAPDCEDEFAALQACGAALPASSFECDEDGFVAPVEGSCPDETAALEACELF